MTNKELQEKYTSLKDQVNALAIDKVKSQTLLETLGTKKSALEDEILKLAKANTLEEAKEKLDLVKKTLDDLVTQAENLLKEE